MNIRWKSEGIKLNCTQLHGNEQSGLTVTYEFNWKMYTYILICANFEERTLRHTGVAECGVCVCVDKFTF